MVNMIPYQSHKTREPRIGGHHFYVRLAASVIFTIALIALIVLYRWEVAPYPRENYRAFFPAEYLAACAAWAYACLSFRDTPTRPRRIIAWAWLVVCVWIIVDVLFCLPRFTLT